MATPYGKAKDYAPGEERYTDVPKRSIYRHGYTCGLAGAGPEHNPHGGKTARTIWEAGRVRATATTAEGIKESAGDAAAG